MTWQTAAAELLTQLVRTPSPSGEEAAVAEVLAAWADDRGLTVSVDDAAVRLETAAENDGPTLLFASHLDTVPPGEGWSCDPYEGRVENDRLTGRGAVDAKASVAAMSAAAAAVAARGGPARGRLVVLATYGEETRHTSMPAALERLDGRPDAAVVGEPTSLEPAVAQRGLLLLRLVWSGEQLHAGWAADRQAKATNAIFCAAADLARLEDWQPGVRHPALGWVTITPTMLEAGVARNVTPPRCEAVLDVRTTPAHSHAEVVALVSGRVHGAVEVISDRLEPAQTPPGSALLAALCRLRPSAVPFASPTCSDWVFLRHLDAIKLGPGISLQSHRPDESIALGQVREAVGLYTDLAREYLS